MRRRQGAVAAPVKTRKHGGGRWLALGGIIAAVAGFANWDNGSSPDADRTLVIPADASNACRADVTIGSHTFRVLLDSGAVGAALVFGSNHAAALGFSPRALSYSQTYSSANGEGREAVVRLHDVRLHGWQLGGVTAVITRAPQDEGLFGAELLHRLKFRTGNGFCGLTMPEGSWP
jgi:clan AA aspartic protease (TIGR02281 family)